MPRHAVAGTLMFSNVFGGNPPTSTRMATRRAIRAASSKSPPSMIDTAMDDTDSRVPSIAAETVPEYVTSSPRFDP